jgi:hypothetical protein
MHLIFALQFGIMKNGLPKIKLIFVLICIPFLGCINDKREIVHSDEYDILISYNSYQDDESKRNNAYDRLYLRDGNLYLIFESSFDQDTVEISLNGDVEESDILTTDAVTGCAKDYKFEEIDNIRTLGIRINGGKKAVIEIDTMNFFIVNLNDTLMCVQVLNHVPLYY